MYGTNVNKLGVKNINTDMYNKTWNMITIVLQESPSNEEKLFSNRTNCKIYFNSTLISDRSTYNNDVLNINNETGISTAMKNNIGNLYINPKKNIGDAYNNNITNLKVLCPNCHSLTKTYKNIGNRKSSRTYRNLLP